MNEQEADDDSEQMSLILNRFYSDSSLREFIGTELYHCQLQCPICLLIQISFCLRKLEKIINLDKNVLTFFF